MVSGKSTRIGRILKPDMATGYARVSLHLNGRPRKQLVHQLVADAFVPGYSPGKVVNHIDGDPTNNSPQNLEWVTYKENTIHAWKIGLCTPNQGSRCGRSKLNEAEVLEIRSVASSGRYSGAEIGRQFGVSGTTISYIIKRKIWRHI
jgi:hypothetical protein